MSRLNYNHLRYFHAVAREGNLTRAAERLNLSQSALSTQIRALEERLGHDLFERRGKALHLTEAGRVALDHADRIFGTGEELLSVLAGQGAARRTVRVGALATLSRNFQIGFLRPLLGRPDVEIVLHSGSLGALLLQLEAHRLDVVLANALPPRDAATPWIVHPLAEQTVSLVGPPGTTGTLPDLLAGHALILPSPETGIRAGFDAMMARLGLYPRIAAEVDDMAMLRLLAREGAGLAVVPPIVVADELASGRLAELHALPDLSETFAAVTLARRFPNPLLAELLPGQGAVPAASRPSAGAAVFGLGGEARGG